MWTSCLVINWTGPRLTGEQLLVLQNFAIRHLLQGGKRCKFPFKHKLCEGLMTRQKEGVFVTFPGTFFKADLGTMNGVPWVYEFLVPRGTELIALESGMEDGYDDFDPSTGEVTSTKVDSEAASIGDLMPSFGSRAVH